MMMLTLTGVIGMCEVGEAETRVYTIGGVGQPWEEHGVGKAIDYSARAGWIQPIKTSADENILHTLYAEGRLFPFDEPVEPEYGPGDGRIWSPNAPFQENRDLLMLADARNDTVSFDYFNRQVNNNGVAIYIDLGTAYPVNLLRFYPLQTSLHQDFYMKSYELFACDGRPENMDEEGNPIFHLLNAVPINMDVVVADSEFPPQHIRFIKLRNSSPMPFEIDQIEVRGEGYIRDAAFTSQIINLGQIANFGRLFWAAEEEAGAMVSVSTRVGRDQTTMVYTRINDIGELEELDSGSDEANRKQWERLPDAAKGPVSEDTENWSLWSAAYDSSGQEVATTGPGQFIQIRVDLHSSLTTSKALVDSIAFEYGQPVLAQRLLGRISPNSGVAMGEPQRFTYRVVPQIEAGDIGFDTIEIATPLQAEFVGARVAGEEIAYQDVAAEATEEILRVQLLREADHVASSNDILELDFQCTVLTFGTVFSATAYASWEPGLLGQKVELREIADLTVLGGKQSLGRLMTDVQVAPNPFTPNSDGINDAAVLQFKVLQILRPAPMTVRIYDVAGGLVRELFTGDVGSDTYRLPWDGLTDSGKRAAPGIYVYRLNLGADADQHIQVGTIALAY